MAVIAGRFSLKVIITAILSGSISRQMFLCRLLITFSRSIDKTYLEDVSFSCIKFLTHFFIIVDLNNDYHEIIRLIFNAEKLKFFLYIFLICIYAMNELEEKASPV